MIYKDVGGTQLPCYTDAGNVAPVTMPCVMTQVGWAPSHLRQSVAPWLSLRCRILGRNIVIFEKT